MRFQMTAMTGLLTRHQRLYVQGVNPIIVNESSDPASPFGSDTDSDVVTFDAFKRSLKCIVQS